MTEPQPDPIELTAETLGRDILEALVDELKPHIGFQVMNETAQTAVIDKLRKRVQGLIQEGLTVLFRGHYPACEAVLEGITIKNGLKVTCKIAKGARHWHDIVENEGQRVLLVLADPEQFTQHMDEVRARANQKDLFNEDYKGSKPYRRDEDLPPPAESWADLQAKLNADKPEPQPGDITFGDAQAPAVIEEPKTMAQQVYEALRAVFVDVPQGATDIWSEAECMVAYYWATKQAAGAEDTPARPHWLPMPDPDAAAFADQVPVLTDEATEEGAEQIDVTSMEGEETVEGEPEVTDDEDADATA